MTNEVQFSESGKIIKKALVAVFGKTVSVTKDHGWIFVHLQVTPFTTREEKNSACKNAEDIIQKLYEKKKIKLYTFTSDEGYNTERTQIIVQTRE